MRGQVCDAPKHWARIAPGQLWLVVGSGSREFHIACERYQIATID
jgi:hypothetical protein